MVAILLFILFLHLTVSSYLYFFPITFFEGRWKKEKFSRHSSAFIYLLISLSCMYRTSHSSHVCGKIYSALTAE